MDFLDSLLNNIDEAVIITDPMGKILMLNEPARLQNYALDSSKTLQEGAYLIDIANSKRKKVVRGIIRDINIKKQIEKSFAEFTTEMGSTVYLDITYIPVVNEASELTHIYVFARDITPQKVYERKLTTQSVNISNLIEKANAIMIGVDMLGYITDWNEYCVKIIGYTKTEAYAHKLGELTRSEQIMELVAERLPYEINVQCKGGQWVTLLLSSTPRTTAKGEVVGFTLVGQDITELTGYRRSLEKKVEERTLEVQEAMKSEKKAIELKSRFVSMASHEMRTPLTTILYAADFIRLHSKTINADDLGRKVESIDKQVMHMTHLLDDLLTYTRTESGTFSLTLTSIDTREFLKEIIEEVRLMTKQTHLIIADFFELPEQIVTDEKLLRNITINLLINAIKFSHGKEFVEFFVKHVQGNVVFTIRDYGIGIPADEVDKMFEPFARGQSVSNIQGTGLGLSIVKKAIELLGGSIHFTTKVEHGTTFTVVLPDRISP